MKDVRRTSPPPPAASAGSALGQDLVSRGMAQWRAERPDIDCSGKAVVGRILNLQGIILRAVHAALAPYGLRYPAYAVLATLRVSGAPYRMSSGRLQATLLVTSGGLSNLLRRVEQAGLIRRTDDPADRRGTIVELTAAGFALAEQAMPAHAAAERRLVAMLDGQQQRLTAVLLSRMILGNQAAGEGRRLVASPPARAVAGPPPR